MKKESFGKSGEVDLKPCHGGCHGWAFAERSACIMYGGAGSG